MDDMMKLCEDLTLKYAVGVDGVVTGFGVGGEDKIVAYIKQKCATSTMWMTVLRQEHPEIEFEERYTGSDWKPL